MKGRVEFGLDAQMPVPGVGRTGICGIPWPTLAGRVKPAPWITWITGVNTRFASA